MEKHTMVLEFKLCKFGIVQSKNLNFSQSRKKPTGMMLGLGNTLLYSIRIVSHINIMADNMYWFLQYVQSWDSLQLII